MNCAKTLVKLFGLTSRRQLSRSRSVQASSFTTNPPLRQKSVIAATALPDTNATANRLDVDAIKLVSGDLKTMFNEIHEELEDEISKNAAAIHCQLELGDMAKYYFDGKGKAIRPVIAMTLGHAYNHHLGISQSDRVIEQQRRVAIISEMIHTASLVHDDILDHAETRRGKASVNRKWDISRSAMCGDYILAVGAKLLAQLHNEQVLRVLAQVLADLVHGEFQQLQNKSEDTERFQLYLNKTFNKTASLIAYSCKANALIATSFSPSSPLVDGPDLVERAFQYGRNIGIAFQLIDDLLDFESSSKMLGKPAAADLKLGLATAPVLFASGQFKELETLIARRFARPGDVEKAFDCVKKSDGLERTRSLAHQHCQEALKSIEPLIDSEFKRALASLTNSVIERKS